MDTTADGPPSLPIELYREIVSYIPSKSDLCALSCTSRTLQTLAESLIYHTVESRRRCRTEALCNLLLSAPRLAPHIRSLTIANDERQHAAYPALRAFWDTIARALRRLPHLEVLRIQDGFTNTNSWVLKRTAFQLRELGCDFAFDSDLVAFLDTQTRLSAIDWTDTDNSARTLNPVLSPLAPAAGSLPALQMLHTDSVGMAMTLVPGRPVTHLWVSNEASAMVDQFIASIGYSSGPLLSLRMGFPFHKEPIIQCLSALAQHAPRLRSLGFLRPFTFKDTEIINALSAFHDLHTLVLWNTVTPDTLRALEVACPALRVVACLHYSYAFEYVRMPVNPVGTPQPMHDPQFRLWKDV